MKDSPQQVLATDDDEDRTVDETHEQDTIPPLSSGRSPAQLHGPTTAATADLAPTSRPQLQSAKQAHQGRVDSWLVPEASSQYGRRSPKPQLNEEPSFSNVSYDNTAWNNPEVFFPQDIGLPGVYTPQTRATHQALDR